MYLPSVKRVNAIVRGADILRSLSNGIDRVTDICNRLHLSKSTVHRLLKTLEISDLVRQDPITRRYYLGPLILDLASSPIIAHQNLILSASEEMKALRELSRETVVLHIRIGSERICLEEIESPENIKYVAGKGSIAPIYVGSAGKMLLAELKDEELKLILKNISLVPVGPNTITDKGLLLKELEKVRKQEYSISFGERLAGGASISIPIRNYACPVALSVLGPEDRFKPKMMEVLKGMKQIGTRISEKIMETSGGRWANLASKV